MRRRPGGLSLADRAALARAPDWKPPDRNPPDPTPAGPDPGRPDDGVAGRHCWVVEPGGHPGRWPGLLAEWSRRAGRWQGRVVYAVVRDGAVTLVEAWLPAANLEPAQDRGPAAGRPEGPGDLR